MVPLPKLTAVEPLTETPPTTVETVKFFVVSVEVKVVLEPSIVIGTPEKPLSRSTVKPSLIVIEVASLEVLVFLVRIAFALSVGLFKMA